LNEHVTGARWPSAEERRELLEEAVEVIRLLWSGEAVTHRGAHYTVDRAQLYTLPAELPSILVAAAGPEAAELAGRIGDGLVSTAPDEELVQAFRDAGGEGKPCYGQLTVCWAASEEEAVETAFDWWPNAALGGELGQELPLPEHYEQAAATLTREDVAEKVVCGPAAAAYRAAVDEFEAAGFDHIYLHQVGPDQEGFFTFFERELSLARAA
jgi:G6PDH family F420-dependent oxidoreductase